MATPRRRYFDKPFIILVAVAVVGGGFLFASAAFGLLARGADHVDSVVLNHILLGIGGGIGLMLIAAFMDYRILRRFAPHFFLAALILTSLVFAPYVGLAHGGGKRWLLLWHFSLQPSEILKLAAIVFASAYCAAIRSKIATFKWGLGGCLGILALPGVLLLLQPDLGTLGIIVASVLAVFWAAGLRMRDIAIIFVIGITMLAMLFTIRPYVRDRVMTFLDPSRGAQAEGYQIRQSLIAIGSGGLLGHGFGQGIQKFTYLPEPMGDSIFAVAGEELGFVGTVTIVLLFTGVALRGFYIAARARDPFGTYLAAGIATYLSVEAFINIAAMLGLAPLTGVPLTFMSQGGSAMLVSLASAGVLLSVSRVAR